MFKAFPVLLGCVTGEAAAFRPLPGAAARPASMRPPGGPVIREQKITSLAVEASASSEQAAATARASAEFSVRLSPKTPPPATDAFTKSAVDSTSPANGDESIGSQKGGKKEASEDALNDYPDPPPDCPFSPSEWRQRCALAASYRIAFMEDWAMSIFNHITLKVEGSEAEPDGPHFLLNDYGTGFDEITASSLLKVTLDGTQVGPARGRVFKPGYVLHSAVHGARHDIHAVWHCHHVDATAICQTKTGLLPLSQEATFALAKGLSYHPFEGSANSVDEQPRIVANLGPTNKILMLEDHGPLVAGGTLEEAYSAMWFLTRACQYQVRATSSVGGDLERIHIPCEETLDEMDRRAEKFDEAPAVKVECEESGEETEVVEKHDTEGLMFACARRAAERKYGAENIYV